MKRADFIPVLLAGLTALLGGGLIAVKRRGGQFHLNHMKLDGPWWMLLLLLVAGISLIVFLTYAFAFVNSASIAVI